MLSTHSEYRRSRQEFLLGLQRSKAPIIAGVHLGEDQEEYPRVSLDRLEKIISTLTMMVTQLPIVKGMETPSTKTEHQEQKASLEEFKRKEKHESKIRTKTKVGEYNYNKMSVPFHVDPKVEIKPYVGEIDSIKLNQWLIDGTVIRCTKNY